MGMNDQMERNIKDVITEYPEVGNILDDAGVACVSCGVGTCKLGDIIGIHNLSAEQEEEILTKIAAIIFPGQKVKIPRTSEEGKSAGELAYSAPIKGLVDEHGYIKKLLKMMPKVVEQLDISSDADKTLVKQIVNFIRQYADKYHHAKEEDILFEYFDKDLDILQVMYADHDTARGHVKAVLAGLRTGDEQAVKTRLLAYMELLKEHIKKEDEVLYPWLDKNLSESQLKELAARFKQVDRDMEPLAEKHRNFLQRLESTN